MIRTRNRKKLLVIWPGFDPGKISFYQKLLDSFHTKIIFIRKGGKTFSNTIIDLGPLNRPCYKKKLIFLNHKGFRVSDFNLITFTQLACQLFQIMSKESWDFVFSSTNNPVHSKLAFIYCKIKKIPFGVKVEDWFPNQSNSIFRSFYNKMGRSIIKHSDYAFPHGKAAQLYCRNLGQKDKQIRILPLEIPGYLKSIQDSDIGKKVTQFAYCGRLVPQKNVSILIKAFSLITEKFDHVSLCIAGSGPEEQHLKELVEKKHLKEKIYFRGSYDREDLPDILHKNAVLVLPSLFEGWGMVVNEAASLGRPVIVSRGAAVWEDLVQSNGIVFDPRNVHELTKAMMEMCSLDQDSFSTKQKQSFQMFEQHNRQNKVIEELSKAVTK